jgi:protein-tyrosine phosphatase
MMVRGSAWLHRLLTHPLMMAVKRPVKDALWRLRGRALVNPPAPDRIRSILFVCKGNICRSPFAALRTRQLLRQMDIGGVVCDSGGLDTTQAARPPKEACAAAAQYGVSLDAHRPMQVTLDIIARYDLTIVMESTHLLAMRHRYPDFTTRIVLLPLLNDQAAGYVRYNIADPYGQPLIVFQSCYEQMDQALSNLIRTVIVPAAAARLQAGTDGYR